MALDSVARSYVYMGSAIRSNTSREAALERRTLAIDVI